MDIISCFIKAEYFINNSDFINMLDIGNVEKQSHRSYFCIKITLNKNNYYVPLRNNLGAEIRPFGRIGYSVPSKKRPVAGLDFRYALVINDDKYIEIPNIQRIPNSQYYKICSDYSKIVQEFEKYITGFVKAKNKKRIKKEPLYRNSSLINFIDMF